MDGQPTWELGRTKAPGDITKKPEKLEEDLIEFVNEHPETFNPEEMERIRRGIIRAFAMFDMRFVADDYVKYKPGLSCIAQLILQTISDKTKKGREINTSQEVKDALTNFDVCVEFIDKFLQGLCATEATYSYTGEGGKKACEQIIYAVKQHWPHAYPNIFITFQSAINRYQSRVLNLWADVLIREGKITPAAIAEMQAATSGADGYERKRHGLLAECMKGHFAPNLDESMLLKWLSLFHVELAKDPYMTNLIKTYPNGGRERTLDGIVFGIISQFVPIHNVNGCSSIPQSNKHESELNVMHLTCAVVERNSGQQPPVCAYLSSDVLDQCVQRVGHFPTTDQFIQYMNSRRIEKAAAFAASAPSAPPPSAPPPSAPELSDLGGGRKKTRRNPTKKRKHSKKIRHERRRN